MTQVLHWGVLLAYIGDQTGVFRGIADCIKRTSEEIASIAGVDSRYLKELLSASAANGYVNYDSDSGQFYLTPEQSAVFGTDRFFRPGYEMNLISNWIPALDGVEEKLNAGGTIAEDVVTDHLLS